MIILRENQQNGPESDGISELVLGIYCISSTYNFSNFENFECRHTFNMGTQYNMALVLEEQLNVRELLLLIQKHLCR